jgi:hypothetical protein
MPDQDLKLVEHGRGRADEVTSVLGGFSPSW